MKRLILLLGYPKNGSSAIQVFLRKNADILQSHGICYPLLDPWELKAIETRGFGSGNGVFIVQALKRGSEYQPMFDRMSALSDDTVVIATESFGQISKAQATPFLDWMKGLGVPVRLIAFSRDPFDMALSGYAQSVKAGRQTLTLEQACGRFNDPQQRIRDVFQPEFDIEEYQFRDFRDDIIGAALGMIGPNLKIPRERSQPTNRTLTREELGLLRELNGTDLEVIILKGIVSQILKYEPLGTPLRHSRRSVRALCYRIGLKEADHAHHIGGDEPKDAMALLTLMARIPELQGNARSPWWSTFIGRK